MDRRTFLLVILLSFLLFGVNLFFQNYNTQQKQEWLAQQKQIQIQKDKKLDEAIAKRTVSLSDLPSVLLFSDADQQHFLTAGVMIKGQILTLAWEDVLPSQVFVKTKDQIEAEPFHLAISNVSKGNAVIYQKQAGKLSTIRLSPTDSYDLQLIKLNPGNQQNPFEVVLGEYINGQLSIPRNKLNLTSAEQPLIALLKSPEGFLPVGLVEPNNQTILSFNDLDYLASVNTALQTGSNRSYSNKKTEEKFYVLENDYQQLVFSNYGGALAEINLPFKTKQDVHSVVREIEFDRQMVEQHPENARFPAHPYYTASTSIHANDWVKHEAGQLGGYYPLLRRDLIETGNRSSIRVSPQYYALNLVSDYPELSELVYEVKDFTTQSITFEAVQSHRRITKTYFLGQSDKEGPYCVNLDIKIEGDSRNLWLTSGVPEVEWISGSPAPALKYRITRNQKSEVNTIELPKDSVTVTSLYPDWVCNSNGFLGTILDPLTPIDPGYRVQFVSGTKVPSRLVEIDQQYDRYKAENLPGYMTAVPLKSQGGNMSFRLFAGPFDTDILKQVDALYSDPQTGYNPDYIACQTMHGWFTFISEPFAKVLFVLMKFFHYVTGSWALSIVLLTICLRIILYPLNAWSTKSMIRMQQIAPDVTAIQEKYKKDPKKAQIEVINLYRERGVNPASGCLPLLIQMPFLIGMFDLLKSSFALRGAPFIPGWIDDLTAPDVLFRWNYPIFFIGTEFHLLPILLGLVMFIQQRYFSNAPQDPSLMTDQQRQQRVMGNMMTIVFAIMFYNFPSGLNIYWLSSMILGILQQWYTAKYMKLHTVQAPIAKIKPNKKTAR